MRFKGCAVFRHKKTALRDGGRLQFALFSIEAIQNPFADKIPNGGSRTKNEKRFNKIHCFTSIKKAPQCEGRFSFLIIFSEFENDCHRQIDNRKNDISEQFQTPSLSISVWIISSIAWKTSALLLIETFFPRK